jgi:hypothetical protein
MSLVERKGQLTLLFGSYSRKSKKSGVVVQVIGDIKGPALSNERK